VVRSVGLNCECKHEGKKVTNIGDQGVGEMKTLKGICGYVDWLELCPVEGS